MRVHLQFANIRFWPHTEINDLYVLFFMLSRIEIYNCHKIHLSTARAILEERRERGKGIVFIRYLSYYVGNEQYVYDIDGGLRYEQVN